MPFEFAKPTTSRQDGAMAVIDRLMSWAMKARDAPLRGLPPNETPVVNVRQHPAVLIPKAIRTGSGVGMMISGPTVGLAIIFSLALLADTIRAPRRFKRRTVFLLVVLLTAVLAMIGAYAGAGWRTLVGAAVLIWVAADVLTWFFDRLIVTQRRLYRVHGLLTTHRSSVALQTITVVDLELGPAARWFGTLHFDTPAQRDGPLHRFTYVRKAELVHSTILDLRAASASNVPPF